MKPRRIQRFVLAQVFGPPSPKRADSLAPLHSSWRNQRRKALPQMWAGEDPRPLPAQPPLSGRGSSWCRECPNAATRDYRTRRRQEEEAAAQERYQRFVESLPGDKRLAETLQSSPPEKLGQRERGIPLPLAA